MVTFGLYVHVPFCLRKCTYCDFVSYPYDAGGVALYLEALEQELSFWQKVGEGAGWFNPGGLELATVYLGGGTPTCLALTELERLLAVVTRATHEWRYGGGEYTVEVNPETITEEKVRLLRAGGVNRLSLGIQSCSTRDLSLLGRGHDMREAAAAYDLARRVGLNNINIDLMYAFPGHSWPDFRSCLRNVISWQPEHISLYALEVHAETPLGKLLTANPHLACPEEEDRYMYNQARELLAAAGYVHYEVSNFARMPFWGRHNLNYWRYGCYLGVGPAAASHFPGLLWRNPSSWNEYVALYRQAGEQDKWLAWWQRALAVRGERRNRPEELGSNGMRYSYNDGTGGSRDKEMRQGGSMDSGWELELCSLREEFTMAVIMGLRLLEGIDYLALAERYGFDWEKEYGQRTAKLMAQGLLEKRGRYLRLTAAALPVANAVWAELMGEP